MHPSDIFTAVKIHWG